MLKGDNSPFWFSPNTFSGDMSMWWDANSFGQISGLPTLAVYGFSWSILQSFGISNGIIQVVIMSTLLIISGLAIFYFLSILIGNKPLPLLIGSIFYMVNISVVMSIFNVGMSWMRAFLPLVLALFLQLIQKRIRGQSSKRLCLYFLLIFSFSMSFLTVNPPILIISILCLFVIGLYGILIEGKYFRGTVESIKIVILSILTSLWWIIPLGLLAVHTVGAPAQNLNLQAWSWTHSRSSILNILWLNADWGWLPEYVPFIEYFSNPLVILATFVPMGLAAFGLLFKRRNRLVQYLFFAVILIAVFLAKGLHSPLEQVNIFLYTYLPGFATLFREPVSKFTFMITLFVAPLIACSVDSIITAANTHVILKLRLPRKLISFSIVIFLSLVLLIPAAPMVLGWVAETKTEQLPFPSYVQVPSYWFELGNYFSADVDDFRVLVLPDDDFYQMPYTWGYYGSDALPLRFASKPVVYHTYGYQQQEGGELLDVLYQSLENEDKITFNNLLNVMNIKYLLVRNDIFWNFTDNRHIANPEHIKDLLSNNDNVEFVQRIGALDIFKSKSWVQSHFYVPTRVLTTESFAFNLISMYSISTNDVLLSPIEFEQVVNISPQIQNCSLYILDFNDLDLTENKLFKDFNLSRPGLYMINLFSEVSLPLILDNNVLDILSNGDGSFITSPIYLDTGIHRIEIGFIEDRALPLDSWEDVSVGDPVEPFYTIEIEQDALRATLYSSTYGWKSLASPVIEVNKKETYTFSFEVSGENAYQLHGKIFEFDENFTILSTIQSDFLLEDTFDFTSLNVTYSLLNPETKYVQLALWHGHETTNPLPNIIWLKNPRLIINRNASFDGLLLSKDTFLSGTLEPQKSEVALSYDKLSSHEYIVHVETDDPFFLVFSESYDSLWKVIEGTSQWYEVPLDQDLSLYHLSANGFGNVWYINKTGSFDLTIYYTPQSFFYYALIISVLTFMLLSFMVVVFHLNKKKGNYLSKKWSSNVTILVFGSSTPVSGFFIRTRQIARALSKLNLSINILEFGSIYQKMSKNSENVRLNNLRQFTLPLVSQTSKKNSKYSPLRQLAFQLGSLKILLLAGMLRRSNIVLLTSCLQIIPALVSKILGAKIILDINDVNSRVALRTPDLVVRIIRYVLWRPLESLGCFLADIIIVNKEDEGNFLISHLKVDQSKIFVLKTCLEDNKNLNNKQLTFELNKFAFEKKKVVLFLSNMSTFMNRRSAQYIISELAPNLYRLGEFKEVLFVLAGVGSDNLQLTTSNIITTGSISQTTVNALVARADICIDPAIISGGVKTKIQHYLQKGKIVVTTPYGAEGINLYNRNDIAFLESRIEDFEETLKYALRNLLHLKKLSVNNREIYEKQFSWDSFVKQLKKLMEKIAKKNNQQ